MMGTRNFLLCACFLAVLCTAYAELVAPVAPAVTPKKDLIQPVTEAPVVVKKINEPEIPTETASASNVTEKNTTSKDIIVPSDLKNSSSNASKENVTQTTLTPLNKPVTPAPPVVITTVNATTVNVTEVPPKANATLCIVEAPTVAPTAASVQAVHGRYFDGLSFIGGMVLAVGLLGIGRVAFKIYKNRSDAPNYLTL